MTAHRNALNPLVRRPVGGRAVRHRLPPTRPDGVLFTGDPTKLESYPYFGADIHAVAEGRSWQ